MNIETIKVTLLAEIQDLEESLQVIVARIKKGSAIGAYTNLDTSKVNNLIGKYQLLMEIALTEKSVEPNK